VCYLYSKASLGRGKENWCSRHNKLVHRSEQRHSLKQKPLIQQPYSGSIQAAAGRPVKPDVKCDETTDFVVSCKSSSIMEACKLQLADLEACTVESDP
jgi:hypothetical protein